MIELRASQTPTAMRCLRSMDPVDVEVDVASEANIMGTFIHQCFAQYISTAEYRINEWKKEGKALGVDESDLEGLLATALSMWGDEEGGISPTHGPELYFEEYMEAFAEMPSGDVVKLTGHPDVFSFPEKNVCKIDDLKSGLVRSDAFQQLEVYAMLISYMHPEVEEFRLGLMWIRHNQYDEYVYTRDQIQDSLDALVERLSAKENAPYVTGTHCMYCRNRIACPAWEQQTASLMRVVQHPEIVDGINELARREQLGQAYVFIRQIESLCKTFVDGVKQHIEASGPVDVGENTVLDLRDSKRTVIDTQKALPVLREHFEDDEIADALRTNKSKIVGLAKAAVPKGQGARAERELMQELENVDAINYKVIQTLRQVKAGN